MIKIFDLIGRVFISGIFLLSGYNKIVNYDGTIGWMESFGLPGFLLIPAIILEILAPLLIIIGYQTRIAAGALSLFCIATAIIFHTDFSDSFSQRFTIIFSIFHILLRHRNLGITPIKITETLRSFE